MRRDSALAKPIKSSFLSVEKDAETILKKLFISSQPYSDLLKRLLIINTKDCLDGSNENYSEIIKNTSVKELLEDQYITLIPRIPMKEHEEVKSYIILSFDEYMPTTNPEYRDCSIYFDILCPTQYWDLCDYQLRPLKIAGTIDGILNGARLSGIGQLEFVGGQEFILNEDFGGYTLMYRSVHGNDDKLPIED